MSEEQNMGSDNGDTKTETASKTFEHVWTVRFSDTDPYAIAHYPRIIDSIHEIADVFMQKIGFPIWVICQEKGYGLPIVEIDFEFMRPVRAGDEVTVELTPSLGTKSVRFNYIARCDNEVVFSGYEQRVCAEQGGGESMEIPDDLRAALKPYAVN